MNTASISESFQCHFAKDFSSFHQLSVCSVKCNTLLKLWGFFFFFFFSFSFSLCAFSGDRKVVLKGKKQIERQKEIEKSQLYFPVFLFYSDDLLPPYYFSFFTKRKIFISVKIWCSLLQNLFSVQFYIKAHNPSPCTN